MDADTIIVGGGIAGAAVAYFLSARQKVVILEREDAVGYHSTGRSAAIYTENYGSDAVSALVRASRPFLSSPPPGFAAHQILGDLGVLTLGGSDQATEIEEAWLTARRRVSNIERHPARFATDRVPILRPERIAECIFEPDARSIDVETLLQGYLRGLAQNGGKVVTGADVTAATRKDETWRVRTSANDEFRAPVLVNAAGAWADDVARLAGVRAVGLEPRRRTAVLIDPPAGVSPSGWPMVNKVGGTLYFRPFGPQILFSPTDQTPTAPADVRPDELDIAIAVDRLEQTTTLAIKRIQHSWAGLRSFAADEIPVVGWDAEHSDFYWVAGQGGAGIKISPALGMIAASDILNEPWPDVVRREEVAASDIAPARFAKTQERREAGRGTGA